MQSVRTSSVDHSFPLCNQDCMCFLNYAIRSILYDFQSTRTISLHPFGTHTMIEPGYNKLDSCSMPVLVYYSHSLQNSNHNLPLDDQSLEHCKISCQLTNNKSDADILVGFHHHDPELRSKEWWQKVAIINLHPSNINVPTLASADILISFHRYSDVKLNFFGSILKDVLCANLTDGCIGRQFLSRQFHDFANLPGKAVLQLDDNCDRHASFVYKLVDSLRRYLPVDAIGECFASERGGTRSEIKNDRHTYKFNLVLEDEIVEDYVTVKFYQGMLAAAKGSLMIYLGAPNADAYAVRSEHPESCPVTRGRYLRAGMSTCSSTTISSPWVNS
eukprot:767983-Hanusia_phi.AAC.8